MIKRTFRIFAFISLMLLAALTGGSFYMLDYSLAPDPNRADTDSCYRQLYADYHQARQWVDSLRECHALRDTFLMMPR